jgi:hypothetical protein
MTDTPLYRFAGPAGTVWLGLPLLGLTTVGVSLTVAVGLLYFGAPLLAGGGVLVLGAAAALIPLSGRPAVGWLPAAGRHLTGRTTGAAATPAVLPADPPADWVHLPTRSDRVRLTSNGAVGFLTDRRAGSSVVVLAVAGSDRFALLDPAAQAQLLTGWGDALASLAADPRVHRIQWVQTAGPENREHASWLTGRAGGSRLACKSGLVEDYTAMVDRVSAAATRHQVFVAVAYRDRDVPPVAELTVPLLTAGLLGRALEPAELAGVIRRGHDVTLPPDLPVLPDTAGPASVHRGWDRLRTDDTHHRSFAVAGWPRLPVGPGWMESLLLAAPTGLTRTLSVHLIPVGQAAAVRQARAARTRAALDRTERARLGLADTATAAATTEETADTEAELVAGFRLQRISGIVTVSTTDPELLDSGCRTVISAAVTARLDLRPCHGHHDLALTATLPLCRPGGRAR